MIDFNEPAPDPSPKSEVLADLDIFIQTEEANQEAADLADDLEWLELQEEYLRAERDQDRQRIAACKKAIGIQRARGLDSNQWPDVLPLVNRDQQQVSFDILPGCFKEFALQVTTFAQTPPALAIFQCLGMLAAALQKRFVVSPFAGYSEILALWLLVFLDPGTRKTLVQGLFKAPAVEWEQMQAKRLQAEIIRVNHQRDLIDEQIKTAKQRVSKGNSDAATTAEEIMRLELSKPDFVTVPRILADDVTPETLQNIMATNGERMAVVSDEGGVFESISGLYSKNGSANINVFLQSHAGSAVRVDRGARSVSMQNPALTLCLSIQPSILQALAGKSGWRGNGFLARNLYAIPTSTVGSRDVRRIAPVDPSVAEAYRAAMLRLLDIPRQADEFGNEVPRVLGLSPEALEQWFMFAEWVEQRQGVGREFHPIQDWTSKLPGAALRVAGLVHVAEHGEHRPMIAADTMVRAINFVFSLIPHAQAAFGTMGADPVTTDAAKILQWIQAQEQSQYIKQKTIHRALYSQFPTVNDLEPGLMVLVDRYYLRGPYKEGTGGRPSIRYEVNPAVWQKGDL